MCTNCHTIIGNDKEILSPCDHRSWSFLTPLRNPASCSWHWCPLFHTMMPGAVLCWRCSPMQIGAIGVQATYNSRKSCTPGRCQVQDCLSILGTLWPCGDGRSGIAGYNDVVRWLRNSNLLLVAIPDDRMIPLISNQ